MAENDIPLASDPPSADDGGEPGVNESRASRVPADDGGEPGPNTSRASQPPQQQDPSPESETGGESGAPDIVSDVDSDVDTAGGGGGGGSVDDGGQSGPNPSRASQPPQQDTSPESETGEERGGPDTSIDGGVVGLNPQRASIPPQQDTSLTDFARRMGLSPPDTAEQRQILRQLRSVRSMKDEGFTRSERKAGIFGQKQIEKAETVTETNRVLQQLESEFSSFKEDVKSQISDIRDAPPGTTFTVTVDGEQRRFSKSEAVDFYQDRLESVRQRYQDKKDRLRQRRRDAQEDIKILGKVEEAAVATDPLQGTTPDARFQKAGPLERVPMLVSSQKFEDEAQAAAGPVGKFVAGIIPETAKFSRAVGNTFAIAGSTIAESNPQAFTPIADFLPDEATEEVFRGLGWTAADAITAPLVLGSSAAGVAAGLASGNEQFIQAGKQAPGQAATGIINQASSYPLAFSSSLLTEFAVGGLAESYIGRTGTRGRTVTDVRASQGDFVLTTADDAVSPTTLSRTVEAPADTTDFFVNEYSARTTPTTTGTAADVLRTEGALRARLDNPPIEEDLPYTQPAPRTVAGTLDEPATGGGKQDFLVTVEEDTGILEKAGVFRPVERQEEVTAVIDRMTATTGGTAGTGRLASVRSVTETERLVLGPREQARMLAGGTGSGFTAAGETTITGEPFRFSSRTLFDVAGKQYEAAPGLVEVGTGENPFTVSQQRYVLPESEQSPTTRQAAVFDVATAKEGDITYYRAETGTGFIETAVVEDSFDPLSVKDTDTDTAGSLRGDTGDGTDSQMEMQETTQDATDSDVAFEGIDQSFIETAVSSDQSQVQGRTFIPYASGEASLGQSEEGQRMQATESRETGDAVSMSASSDVSLRYPDINVERSETVGGRPQTDTFIDVSVGGDQEQGGRFIRRAVEMDRQNRGLENMSSTASVFDTGQRTGFRFAEFAVPRFEARQRERQRTRSFFDQRGRFGFEPGAPEDTGRPSRPRFPDFGFGDGPGFDPFRRGRDRQDQFGGSDNGVQPGLLDFYEAVAAGQENIQFAETEKAAPVLGAPVENQDEDAFNIGNFNIEVDI